MIPSEDYHSFTEQVLNDEELHEEDNTNLRTDASGRRGSQEQIMFEDELPPLVEERLDTDSNSNLEDADNETRVGSLFHKKRKNDAIQISIEDEERQPCDERLQPVDDSDLTNSSPRIAHPPDNETDEINVSITPPPPRIVRLARYGSIGDFRLDGPPPRRQRISSE